MMFIIQKILHSFLYYSFTNEVTLLFHLDTRRKKKERRWTEILFEVFLLLLPFSTFDAMAFSMTEKGGGGGCGG